jgi:hypothetical protein
MGNEQLSAFFYKVFCEDVRGASNSNGRPFTLFIKLFFMVFFKKFLFPHNFPGFNENPTSLFYI